MARTLEMLLAVNLFWAATVTVLSHAFIAPAQSEVLQKFVPHTMSMGDMSDRIQSILTAQTNIPIIDMGALIFYSGIILVDFIMNFIFAVPSIATAAVAIFQHIFGLEATLAVWTKMFVATYAMMVWIIYLLQVILSMRGGARVV